MVPKNENPLGGHDLWCPRRKIPLGNMICGAQEEKSPWGTCYVVPKNKNPHGGHDLWCPRRQSNPGKGVDIFGNTLIFTNTSKKLELEKKISSRRPSDLVRVSVIVLFFYLSMRMSIKLQFQKCHK